jgi:hypothetical protein
MEIIATTVGANIVTSLCTERGMPVNPGEQVLIKLFCANNVLLVIAFHQLPGLRVTGEAVNPKLVAGMAKLAPQPKRLEYVGEGVGWKLELALNRVDKVDLLERRRGLKTKLDELAVKVRGIETLPVVGDQGICFAQQVVSRTNHRPAAFCEL